MSAILCAHAFLGLGCTFKGDTDGGYSAALDDVWRPVPVAMRIYPATRFVRDQGKVLLEARIELFDEMGDSVKAPGVVYFDLFDSQGPTGQESNQRLYTWEVQIGTLEQQTEHYDPITRGYLFRLEVDTARVARRRTLLRAVFSPVDGERVTAESYVRTDW